MSGEQGTSYRARFRGREDLDSETFTDYTGRLEVGWALTIQRDEGRPWRVAELIPEDSGRWTIVFEAVDE